jgi:CheY-like chemotaxis protein
MVADIGMAGRDGIDLIRAVRARTDRVGRIPAIAFTAFAGPDDALRVVQAGYAMHVAKPVDPATLVHAVASLAGRAQRR